MMKRLDYLSITRLFCVVVVVFFHSYQMMWASVHFPSSSNIYKEIYYNLVQCGIINVAMPLFIFASGYLFVYLLKLGKYPTFGCLIRKKTIRVLVPYFVFGLFFMAITNAWHPITILRGGYGHLWFLPMLFWCFVLGYAIFHLRLYVYIEILLLLISFCGTFSPKFVPMWLGLHNISRWFYWFYLGMLVYKYEETLFFYMNRYKLYIPLILLYGVATYLYPIAYGHETWYSNFVATGCLIAVFLIMKRINWEKLTVTPILVNISKYSFGIYVWSAVGPFLVSNTSKELFGLYTLAANHVILFPLCISILTLLISFVISWCMMKTKVGRFLIG